MTIDDILDNSLNNGGSSDDSLKGTPFGIDGSIGGDIYDQISNKKLISEEDISDDRMRKHTDLARILSCDIKLLSGKELDTRERFEKNKIEAQIKKDVFGQEEIDYIDRSLSYDFGRKLTSNEMDRGFYLKERLSLDEKLNLVTLLDIFQKSSFKNKMFFPFAVLGVGTSTYSDSYFTELEDYIFGKGFSKEDYFQEKASCYGIQFTDFKTYSDYSSYYAKQNEAAPFDEQTKIFSEEKFNRVSKLEQKSYSKKKKIKDVLENKGEDLDFVICKDIHTTFKLNSSQLEKDYISFQNNFVDYCLEEGLKVSEEESYLWEASYHVNDGKIIRFKDIASVFSLKTYRVSFEKGRSFHFYFKDDVASFKIRKEIVNNQYFVQLVRNSDVRELQTVILFGNKLGDYSFDNYIGYD